MNILSKLTTIFFLGTIGVFSSASAAEFPDVESAFAYFNTPGGPIPFRDDVDVQRAQQMLATDIPKTKRLVIEALSNGAPKQRANPEVLLGLVGAQNTMEVLRVILATYPPGDATPPISFLGAVASRGDASDMLILKRIFQKQPDSEIVTTLAKLMVEFANVHAATALREMQRTVPGRWQESAELKAFFASASPSSTNNGMLEKSVALETPARGSLSPAEAAKTSKVVPAPAASMSNARWLWVAAGFVAVAIIALVLRRKAKG